MKLKLTSSLILATSALFFTSCTSSLHPVAKPIIGTETKQPIADHYISPFHPYNPIVAKGFKSGQLAGDPSTIKNDPKTGKPDLSTMKIFQIP